MALVPDTGTAFDTALYRNKEFLLADGVTSLLIVYVGREMFVCVSVQLSVTGE
jgi:hypothetical protein